MARAAKAAKEKASPEAGTQNFSKLLDHVAHKGGMMMSEVGGQFIIHPVHQPPGGRKSVAAEMVEAATSLGITPLIPGIIGSVLNGIKATFDRDVHTDNVETLSNLAQQARLYGYNETAAAILEMAANEAAGVEDEE